MEKIITENKEDHFRFVPELPISMIPDITEQRAVETLIRNATPVEVDSFKEILAKRKQESLGWVPNENLAEVQEMWVNQHYYLIFKEVMSGISVGAGRKPASQADAKLEDSAMQVAIVQDMFASPRKRSRNETVHAAQGADATIASHRMFLHIAEIHLRENDFPRGVKILQACVLYSPEHIRHVNSRGKGNAPSESAAIYSVLIGDFTGPCIFDAWRALANNLCTALNARVQGTGVSDMIFIEIEDFDISNENRVHYSSMRKISSNARTRFRIMQAMDSQNMQGNMQADLNILSTDFTLVKNQSPFIISLMGVVGHVGSPWPSSNGNMLQKIRLQDGSGKAVTVMAFDRQVEHDAVIVGNRIMLYFLSATPGLNGRAGTLWAFNESHIVLVRRDCVVEIVREDIEIP
jgi:hypothetical protein